MERGPSPVQASFPLDFLPFPGPAEPPSAPGSPSSAHHTPSSPRVLMANLVLKANPATLALKGMLVPPAPPAPLDPPAPS